MLLASTYQKCEADELLTHPEKTIEEIRARALLLGDGSYPSTTWLVKPHSSNIRLTDTQTSARVIVERGFGLLKGRWRCLLKRLHNDIECNKCDPVVFCFA